MRDCYRWIDPFAEVERADRAEARASASYGEGQRQALRVVMAQGEHVFRANIDMAMEQLARDFSRRVLEPECRRIVSELCDEGEREMAIMERMDTMNCTVEIRHVINTPYRYQVAWAVRPGMSGAYR